MRHWPLIGGLGGATLAVGVWQAREIDAGMPLAAVVVPEQTVSALRDVDRAPLPEARGSLTAELRAKTAGIECALTSTVRRLPAQLTVRVGGHVRTLGVSRARTKLGHSVGEIVLPHGILDDAGWRLSDLVLVAPDGGTATLSKDLETGACVARLGLPAEESPATITCPFDGSPASLKVAGLDLWDADLLPSDWQTPHARLSRGALRLTGVPDTGSAWVDLGLDQDVRVSWEDGQCATIEVSADVEVCARVPGGRYIHPADGFEVILDGERVPLDPEGLACGRARVGESSIRQVWRTPAGEVERSMVVDVVDRGRHDVDLRPLPFPTPVGAYLWVTADGPRVTTVHGLAEEVGIRNGDIIVAIDGDDVLAAPMRTSLRPLFEAEGTVVVTVERGDVLVDVPFIFDEEDTGL